MTKSPPKCTRLSIKGPRSKPLLTVTCGAGRLVRHMVQPMKVGLTMTLWRPVTNRQVSLDPNRLILAHAMLLAVCLTARLMQILIPLRKEVIEPMLVNLWCS